MMKKASPIIILLIAFASCSQIPHDKVISFNDKCVDITTPVVEEINNLMNICSLRLDVKLKGIPDSTTQKIVTDQYERTRAAITNAIALTGELKEIDKSVGLKASMQLFFNELNEIVNTDFKLLISDLEKDYTEDHLDKIVTSLQSIMEKLLQSENSYHAKEDAFQNKYGV